MASTFDQRYPEAYSDKATEVSKQLNVVVCIEGLDQCIGLAPTYTRVRYGDPGIDYGDPGLVWGGYRLDGRVRTGLMLESNFNIQQKLEPEQGRGAVATMSLVFADLDQYFTALISPGVTLTELLGNRLFKVYMGYTDTSFPDDYYVIFRGFASQTVAQSGKITVQVSDANLKRRQYIFSDATTKTTAPITNVSTVIPVVDSSGFVNQILGPNGLYDPGVKAYIQVEDEVMEYGPGGLGGTNITVSARAARGTTAVAHPAASDVLNRIQLSGNVIDIALKLMLSGWGGDYQTDVEIQSIQDCQDFGVFPNAIRLPDFIDAVEEYGLVAGDYVTLSGSTAGNDGVYRINFIQSSNGQSNNILRFVQNFPAVESPAPTVLLALRSQFDTYPTSCGLKMTGKEIDITGFLNLRNSFLSVAQMRFYIKERITGKEFIEKELLLPVGAYSITRFGKMSAKVTLPPIAGIKIPVLDNSNVLEPQNITVERMLNNRRFFNDISYQYDYSDAGQALSYTRYIDTDSLNTIGLVSTLPIQSKGLRTDLGAEQLTNRRGPALLRRYKNAAYELSGMKTNWGTGSEIEAGDVLILKDRGTLQISNLETGVRDLGVQLFEVVDRKVDIKSGNISLRLLSNLGYQVTDRFGVISCSSRVDPTNTSNQQIRIIDSYGAIFPGNEYLKWEQFVGLIVVFHNQDYSIVEERVFTGFSTTDSYVMLLATPLSFVPDGTFTIEISNFPDNTNPLDQELYKLVFSYITPTVDVVTGIDNFNFTVSVLDAVKFIVGNPVSIHNQDYTISSPEALITAVVGTTITVDTDLTFTPAAGQKVELIGYRDASGPYRIL